MLEVISDALTDCVRLLPFLFLSYLAVEYIEHRMDERSKEMIYRAGKAGPLLGSLLGVIPQCGFSAAAAGLYAGRVVSPGTLIAIFLSTSDEMLPLMLSAGVGPGLICRVLAGKVAAGTVIGLLVDLVAVRLHLWNPACLEKPRISPYKKRGDAARPSSYGEKRKAASYGEQQTAASYGEKRKAASYGEHQTTASYVEHQTAASYGEQSAAPAQRTDSQTKDSVGERRERASAAHKEKKSEYYLTPGEAEHRTRMHMCEQGHCHCNEDGIFLAALRHTLQTWIFIWLISLALGFGMEWFQGTAFSRGIFSVPQIQAALSALIGMIPNCAASVLITQLYLEGVLGSGALFSGLLCGAGTGLLVLYRENDRPKENLALTGVLYISGVLAGMLLGWSGLL
ncbi:MAG: arsenic efflux protein [Lachnospiraceae bacterium]|nr:arsenic efflux protein [Lachnospiraceae bacterium]